MCDAPQVGVPDNALDQRIRDQCHALGRSNFRALASRLETADSDRARQLLPPSSGIRLAESASSRQSHTTMKGMKDMKSLLSFLRTVRRKRSLHVLHALHGGGSWYLAGAWPRFHTMNVRVNSITASPCWFRPVVFTARCRRSAAIRLARLEHLALRVDRVAFEQRIRQPHLVPAEIGDGVHRQIGDRLAGDEREREARVHQRLLELGLARHTRASK